MRCNFCGREVENGIQECPYCHYRFNIEAKVLDPRERDTFDGITIEGDPNDETKVKVETVEDTRERTRQEQRTHFGQRPGAGPKIYVKNVGCGGGIVGMIVTLIVIGAIIFFLPAIFVFGIVMAGLYYLLSFFK